MARLDNSGSDPGGQKTQGGAVVIDMDEHAKGELGTLWLVGLNQTTQNCAFCPKRYPTAIAETR